MTITQKPRVSAILLDLDDTLYENTAMQMNVAENIRRYMVEQLDIPADEVAEQCAELYLNYGTTLAGLVANGHTIDYDDWHNRVHACLPYETYLKPDLALRDLLNSIPLPKYIFTNADAAHAARCLDLLGIAGCFQAPVVAFEEVQAAAAAAGLAHHGRPVVCKPNRQAFDLALQLAGGLQAGTTLWLDDSARNITTGHKLGMYSVLVGRTGVACPADQQIRHIHDLPTGLPWLWAGQQPPPTPVPVPAPLGADETASGSSLTPQQQLPAKVLLDKSSGGKVAAGSSEEETIQAVLVPEVAA